MAHDAQGVLIFECRSVLKTFSETNTYLIECLCLLVGQFGPNPAISDSNSVITLKVPSLIDDSGERRGENYHLVKGQVLSLFRITL